MKKYLMILAALFIAVCLLASCGGEEKPIGGDSYDTAYPDDAGSLKIGVKEEDGRVVEVGVDEDKDLASYVIVCADEALRETAEKIQSNIGSRTDISLEIVSESTSERQISVALDESQAVSDYSVTADGNKILLSGGSSEAVESAGDVFMRFFLYASNKSLFVPAGRGYKYELTYFIDKLTVDGIDIKEFSIYSDEGNASIEAENKFDVFAAALNEKLSTLMGITLPIAGEKADGGHYIVVSASASLVNPYSIRIENGDLCFTGSFLSVDAALDAFVGDLLGYTEGTEEHSKTLELTASDNKDGSLGLTVPYTKDELMTLLTEMYKDDTKIISGSHTWGFGNLLSGMYDDGTYCPTNGTDVQETVDAYIEDTGKVPGILELDIGKFGPYRKENGGEDLFRDYDLSKLVSESMKHVSEGGIIALCAHLGNPYMNDSQGKWYGGVLPGGDDDVKAIVTKGTELNEKFHITANDTHRLVKAFKDNGIPFLFRPFHEMNGDWFWWCMKAGGDFSNESFISLWQYEYNYVTNELGVDNALWVYSAGTNGGTGANKAENLAAYPGDAYVDIVGEDWYTYGNQEYNAGDGYTLLMGTGKVTAVTEVGSRLEKKDIDGKPYIDGYDCLDLLSDLKQMIAEGLDVAYACTWTRWQSIVGMEKSEEFMNDEFIVTRDELKEYWANN